MLLVSSAGAAGRSVEQTQKPITACALAVVDVTDKAVYDECFGAGIADAAIFRLSAGLKIVDAGGNEIADLADARSKAAVADVAAVYDVESTDVLTEFSAYLKSNGVKRATLASSSTAVCMLAADDSRIKVFYRVNDDVTDRDSAVDAIKKANLCGAQTIILGGKTTAETVRYIQSRLKAVWLETDGTKTGIADALSYGVYGVITSSQTNYETVTSLISYASGDSRILGRAPYNVAHRGNTLVHAENTVGAITDAAKAGANHVEIDIRLTLDKQIVLLHDDPVQYAMFNPDGTTASGRISQMTLAQLKELNMKNGDKISTLDEVFAAANGEYEKNLIYLIEIKDENTSNELVKLFSEKIAEYDMADRIALITFHNGHFANIKRYLSDIPVSLLAYTDGGANVDEKAFSFRSGIDMQYDGNGGMTAFYGEEGTKADAYNSAFGYFAKNGYPLWLWTYETSSMKDAVMRGVTGITTNDSLYLTNYVEKLAVENEYKVASLPKDGDTVEIDAITYKGETKTVDATVKVLEESDGTVKATLVYAPEDGFGLASKTVTFIKDETAGRKGCGGTLDLTCGAALCLATVGMFACKRKKK